MEKISVSSFGFAALTAMVLSSSPLSAQVQVVDNFDSGNTTVNQTVTSSFGDPVPGVFGGNRAILLSKADESSATSVTIGSGALTWVQTSQADYGHIEYGTATTRESLSSFNAFRISLLSAPASPGQIEVNFSYYGAPNALYSVWALAPLPTSGIVDIPFASFSPGPGFPPIDFTQAHSVGLTLRGSLLSQGTYVFDDFQAVVVPEPSTLSFVGLVSAGLAIALFRQRNSPSTRSSRSNNLRHGFHSSTNL